MNIVLWILQVILAAVFFMTGFMKVSRSKAELKEMGGERMEWVDDVADSNLRLIGVAELLGAIGLILPQLTGILPILTPLAAVGLGLDMLAATAFHVRRGDPPAALNGTGVLLLLAVFVAYGRFVIVPVL